MMSSSGWGEEYIKLTRRQKIETAEDISRDVTNSNSTVVELRQFSNIRIRLMYRYNSCGRI